MTRLYKESTRYDKFILNLDRNYENKKFNGTVVVTYAERAIQSE